MLSTIIIYDGMVAGDVLLITNATTPSRRLRRLLQSSGNVNEPILVNSFTARPRPAKPVDFDPQTGVVDLTSITFLINVGGSLPPVSMTVRGTRSEVPRLLLGVGRYRWKGNSGTSF